MGEIICIIIGFLFLFGSISTFMSLITDKHYESPIRQSVGDDLLTDVIIADELFSDDDEGV